MLKLNQLFIYLFIEEKLYRIYIIFNTEKDLFTTGEVLVELYGMPKLEEEKPIWEVYTFRVSAITNPFHALSYVKKDVPRKCQELKANNYNRLKGQL